MEFVFAYIAGLLTLINPCVLPVLPIVLVSALNANKAGPLALAAGMSCIVITTDFTRDAVHKLGANGSLRVVDSPPELLNVAKNFIGELNQA